MLDVLGLELTTSGLTACIPTDWATGEMTHNSKVPIENIMHLSLSFKLDAFEADNLWKHHGYK